MKRAALLLAAALAGCSPVRTRIVYRPVNVPVPLVVERRVVVYRPAPPAAASSLLDRYDEAHEDTLDAASRTSRLDTLSRLNVADEQARVALGPVFLRPRHATRAEIEAARQRVDALKALATHVHN